MIESWSGHFHPTNPTGTKSLDLGSTAANRHASADAFVGSLRKTFAKRPTFFAFYVGAQDARFVAENVQLHRELALGTNRHSGVTVTSQTRHTFAGTLAAGGGWTFAPHPGGAARA